MTINPQQPPQRSTNDLLKRGWTRAGVKKFLGEPYRRERCHAYNKGDYIVHWYLAADVRAAERRKAFKVFQARKTARSEAAKKAVRTKHERTMAYVEALEIQVPEVDLTVLQEKACASYNSRANERGTEGGASLSSDSKFLDRITVNYIRHELTSYEENLYEQFGKVGIEDAIEAIRARVYDAINEKYPELASECDAQQARRLKEWLDR
jgi:hypothetical protein